MPISIQDFTGHELVRTYSDEWGIYNALVPSTYTTNIPNPTGVSPGLVKILLNHPGFDPANGALVELKAAGVVAPANPAVIFMGNEQTRTSGMIAVPAPNRVARLAALILVAMPPVPRGPPSSPAPWRAARKTWLCC